MKSVRLTGCREDMTDVNDLRDSADFFKYQSRLNSPVSSVPSHEVIEKYIKKHGEDYRFETAPNAEKTLRDRKSDNTETGRKKGV